MPKKRGPETKGRRGAVQLVVKKKRGATVRPEELTSDERAALAEKVEAVRQRRRPPSI